MLRTSSTPVTPDLTMPFSVTLDPFPSSDMIDEVSLGSDALFVMSATVTIDLSTFSSWVTLAVSPRNTLLLKTSLVSFLVTTMIVS